MSKFTLLLTSLVFASCVGNAPSAKPELVMTPGMVIEAETKEGRLRIAYVDTYTREYAWGATVKRFKHRPRRERWSGSLGMYRPEGDASMHAVLEEGQQHFK
ncbi:MAG TPA: hypothetical protein VD994_13400 [Prosthecobacter sp.]|nr:hypothetical protein [Prosthecobacter sp.]